jgi:hypothetical protein
MLRMLSQHRAVRACVEVLANAALYVAIVLIGIVLLGQMARLAL